VTQALWSFSGLLGFDARSPAAFQQVSLRFEIRPMS
jgi:hypothetical protein